MEEQIILHVLSITLVYFTLGAFLIFRINRKKESHEKKNLWIKYFTYLFLVHFIIGFIIFYPDEFQYLAILIVLIGLYEMVKVTRLKPVISATYIAFVVYLITASGFIFFAHNCDMGELLFIYLMVFIFDGFSQITGQLLGKRKLSPTISPNKTIEGFLGGLIMATLTACIISPMPVLKIVFYAIILCFSCLAGDLGASYYKRKTGVKDYSNLIPGHGGILDRFDSFIAAGCTYSVIVILQ